MTSVDHAVRDQPLIAIDVVPMSYSRADGLRVATSARAFAPYAGAQALPGVLLDGTELLARGAMRALRVKAGITGGGVRHLAQIGAFDGPERDPRSAAISVAFLAVVDPAAAGENGAGAGGGAGGGVTSVLWGDARDTRGLPFDHDRIVRAALDTVRTRRWSDVPLTRALLGETFTTADAARLESVLAGHDPHAGNFHRFLQKHEALERRDPSAAVAGAAGGRPGSAGGRPAAVWGWRVF
ncbi:NUDIX hydrolase [Curtobacterium sp. Leaf261]|uniref:NUDIX hydrolase n=1 Tax=Curtobacterium sp. Leaf261 TaxID=1736311 RepID=UPI0006FCBE58|nr:NUDIX hydrolase [Curtobacterium sp. Leaf261]KQO64539.1 hypothetical protein ASF23_16275 [Curtobacterium sp. Leaf261]